MDFLEKMLANGQTLTAGDVLSIVLRLIGAAVLGVVVALLFRHSRSPHERRKGFSQALVLLAPLIAMVTMAIGTNVAAAFTLVGTLAIVRFRTAVRDTRDTVFVIFSVAVGMAMGTLNLAVAACGTVVLSSVIVVMRAFESIHRNDRSATAELRIVLSPTDTERSVYEDVLARFASDWTVAKVAIDRAGTELDLKLTVGGTAAADAPALLVALLQRPQIVRAAYSSDEDGP